MTIEESLEAALRERRAVNAGIAKAALWLSSSEGRSDLAQDMLVAFEITVSDLRSADAVERIEYYGHDIEDAVSILQIGDVGRV